MRQLEQSKRAKVGQYATAIAGTGQVFVGTLYETSSLAKRLGDQGEQEVFVLRRESDIEFRVLAFFCPLRGALATTSRALTHEQEQLAQDFNLAGAL